MERRGKGGRGPGAAAVAGAMGEQQIHRSQEWRGAQVNPSWATSLVDL